MLLRLTGLLVCAAAMAFPQPFRFEERLIGKWNSASFTGYAMGEGRLFAWGDRVVSWSIPSGKMRVLAPHGQFAEGGCLMDVTGRGPDLVLNEGPPQRALIWLEAPTWKRHIIDTGVYAADILPLTLFGRRGILLIHRGAQARFYEIPRNPAEPWPVREIYSFYTPSDQGGLAIADIDSDRFPDIVAGNDWIRSPASFELPWHIFAIELWNEEPKSAMLRQGLADLFGTGAQNLVAVQRRMPEARLAWFEKPTDPKQLWAEHRIEVAPPLNHPNSLAVADFDGDGKPDLLVAERGGAGRLLVFRNAGGGRFEPHVISSGRAIDHALAVDWDGDGRPDIVTIREGAISLWQNRR